MRIVCSVRNVFGALVMGLLITSCQCSKDNSSTSGESAIESPEAKLLSRGKAMYMANCISCHNPNPKLPGSVGPEIFGSSKELLTARVTKAAYPDGYKPKRESHLMPAMPQLSGDIDAIYAFLNAP